MPGLKKVNSDFFTVVLVASTWSSCVLAGILTHWAADIHIFKEDNNLLNIIYSK